MFEILEFPKCDTEMCRANAVGKMVLTDLLEAGLTHTFNLQKTQYL